VVPQIVVTPPAYPPLNVRTRLKGFRLSRGRTAAPVPAQVVIVPPAYPPRGVRAWIKGLRLFRGRANPAVVHVCDCTTHRPNTGTTARPGTGITARPNTGTTGRPCDC
jgi:hypothetical protein